MARTKRTKSIKIFVTEEEHKILMDKKNKFHLAAWMREFCLDADSTKTTKVVPDVDPKLLRQLAGLGTNLNQIAKVVNQSKGEAIEKINVLTQLVAIEQNLTELKNNAS